MTAFIVFRLLSLRCKSFIAYENYYINRLLALFLGIFSASLSGSDDFVLFDLETVDGNCAYLQMFYATLQFCVQVKAKSHRTDKFQQTPTK